MCGSDLSHLLATSVLVQIKQTWKYFLRDCLKTLHPSACPSRPKQAPSAICKYYLTALLRTDEHSATVDDNEEFDETTTKEKQKLSSFSLFCVCVCMGGVPFWCVALCYRTWQCRGCGSSVLAGRRLWCFDRRMQSHHPSGLFTPLITAVFLKLKVANIVIVFHARIWFVSLSLFVTVHALLMLTLMLKSFH